MLRPASRFMPPRACVRTGIMRRQSQRQTHRGKPRHTDFFPQISSEANPDTQTSFLFLRSSNLFRPAVGDACGGRDTTVWGERRRLPQEMGDRHMSQVAPGHWQGPKHVCLASLVPPLYHPAKWRAAGIECPSPSEASASRTTRIGPMTTTTKLKWTTCSPSGSAGASPSRWLLSCDVFELAHVGRRPDDRDSLAWVGRARRLGGRGDWEGEAPAEPASAFNSSAVRESRPGTANLPVSKRVHAVQDSTGHIPISLRSFLRF